MRRLGASHLRLITSSFTFGYPAMDQHPIQEEDVMLLVDSCYEPELGASLDEPHGSFNRVDWT